MSEKGGGAYGSEWQWVPGDPWRICDRCGFKYRSSQTKKEWTGLIVCASKCWEPRHPQDFVKAKHDRQITKDPRPESTDVFVDIGDVTTDDL